MTREVIFSMSKRPCELIDKIKWLLDSTIGCHIDNKLSDIYLGTYTDSNGRKYRISNIVWECNDCHRIEYWYLREEQFNL